MPACERPVSGPALPGSVAWIERLRGLDKRIGLCSTGERASTALAGIT